MTHKESSEKYFSISVVARMLGVHQQTLRIYEKEGLIKPERTQGNTRLYTEKDIEHIKLILRLTNELGVNLAGVGVILQMRKQMEQMQREHEENLKMLVEELTREFFNYLQGNSSLPVVSYRKNLIITHKGNIR